MNSTHCGKHELAGDFALSQEGASDISVTILEYTSRNTGIHQSSVGCIIFSQPPTEKNNMPV